MSSTTTKESNKIRHIVRIHQMVKRWRGKAGTAKTDGNESKPLDVPAGHVVIIAGESKSRFIVPATYLNHPIFKNNLLVKAEEVYGFNNMGPLTVPCDDSAFEEILRVLGRGGSDQVGSKSGRFQLQRRYCHVDLKRSNSDITTANGNSKLGELRPLLRGSESRRVVAP